jgi:hypothetical protein
MAITHPENLVFAIPDSKIDQIVDIITGSLSVGAGVDNGFGFITAATTDVEHIAHEGKAYLYKGVWSFDNGATWQDLGNSVIVGSASGSGLRTLTLGAGFGTDHGLDSLASLDVGASNEGTIGYTILYKILCLARPDQGSVTGKALIQPLRYSSANKYMKIHKEGLITLPTSGTTSITHDLGYIPNFNAWALITFDLTAPDSLQLSNTSNPYVDTRNFNTTLHSTASVKRQLYYRIYKDQ